MKQSAPTGVRCRGCGSVSFAAGDKGLPICEYCGATHTVTGSFCRHCQARLTAGAPRCTSCGAVVARKCPVCGSLNTLEVHRCIVCGQILDASESVFKRLATTAPDQLRRVRETGVKAKEAERRASTARSASLWADEARRREAWAEAQAESRRQERLIFALGAVLVALVILIALVVTWVGGHPVPCGSVPVGGFGGVIAPCVSSVFL